MTQIAADVRRGESTAVELHKYLALSAVALTADVGTLWLLTTFAGIDYLIANCFAFLIGTIVAYVGSVVWVFKRRRLDNRATEYVIFALIGIVGLTVNEAGLWLGVELLLMPLLLAKALAAGASFAFNFALRKMLLFT